MAETLSPETKKLAEKLKKSGTKWKDRIEQASKRENEWLKDAAKAEAIYLSEVKDGAPKQYFNILHSNVETIVPATYNSTPAPDIRRRFGDEDPISKTVADILERSIKMQIDDGALDGEMEGVAQSAFSGGRGVIRLRLYTEEEQEQESEDEIDDAVEETAQADDGDGEDDEQPEAPEPKVGRQEICFEAFSFKDVRFGPAKRWKDVPWMAYRHSIPGETIAKWEQDEAVKAQITATATEDGSGEDKGDTAVWEVWDKSTRKVMFIKDTDGLVYKVIDDPLKLSGFFPSPRPVQPLEVVGRFTPLSPFKVYEELANELEVITKRIQKIVAGIKVRGGAAAGETLKEIAKIAQLDDNEIGEIRGVEALAQQGGLDKAITWWPIEKAVEALRALAEHRESTKAQIYEVTGISDIVRGASNAQETARAQEIKTQWGSLRIQKMQRLLERCVRDIFVMCAELISTKFTDENIQAMTGIQLTPEINAVLRDRVTQFYRVDVESESTIKADLSRTRGEMTQFMQGATAFISSIGPMVQEGAIPANVAIELFSAFSRTFKLGKAAEDVLSQLATQTQQQAQQPPPQKPDPVAQKMKQEDALHQQQLAFNDAEHKQKLSQDAQTHAQEMLKKGAVSDPSQGGQFVDKHDANAAAIMKALQFIAQAVMAPKKVDLIRDPQTGRASGAVQTPMMQPPQAPPPQPIQPQPPQMVN
jgi:hypothetical protein